MLKYSIISVSNKTGKLTKIRLTEIGSKTNGIISLIKETQRWFNQFDAENEYNTPSAQAQRLAAAGLNPSVIMSQGQAGAGLSSAPPQST